MDIDQLAKSTSGFSGAGLYDMVNSAALMAVRENLAKVPMRFLLEAGNTVIAGICCACLRN